MREIWQGPAGALEVALDQPAAAVPAKGLALVCHPHPLHGGTLDNKVVQTLVRACLHLGWRTLRLNYRGVGKSEGRWDEGRGETDDAQFALHACAAADEPILLAGFSFGGFVAAQLAQRLEQAGRSPHRLVLVGPATVIPGVGHFFHGQLPLLKSVVLRALDPTTPA